MARTDLERLLPHAGSDADDAGLAELDAALTENGESLESATGDGPRPMTDQELQTVFAMEADDAESWVDTEIGPMRERLTLMYKGELPLPAGEGRSSFVSRDVHDTVQKLLPSMIRIFFGAEKVAEYIPTRAETIESAKQATDYAWLIVRDENPGFQVFYDAIKDALYQKGGYIQYWWDESTEVTGSRYSGIPMEQLGIFMDDPECEVRGVHQYPMPGWTPPPAPPMPPMAPQGGPQGPAGGPGGPPMPMPGAQGGMPPMPAPEPPQPPQLVDFELVRRVKRKTIRLQAVPPEEMLFNRSAKTPENARFAARRCYKTVSELVAMGIPWELAVDNAGSGEDEMDQSGERYARNPWRNDGDDRQDPAMRLVPYYEGYMLVDFDGDGIAERRKICAIGTAHEIVLNEIFDDVPFVDLVTDPIPHTIISECPGESVADIQNIKSNLIRLGMDSMAQGVNPRTWAVDGQVNIDDLMNSEVGGVVRVRGPGMMGVVETSNSATSALSATQYFDEVMQERVGQTKASAGLDADALQSSTKEAVQMTRDAANDRKELMARVMAERGLKKLFRGILRLMVKHQDQPKMIQLRGEWVQIDPRSWDANMGVMTNVGLGSGNKQERIGFLQTVTLPLQQQVMQTMGPGNPFVSFTQLYNTIEKMHEIAGVEAVSQFFSKPAAGWSPPPPQQQPNPLVEAEKIKAQARIDIDKAKDSSDADFQRDKLVVDTVMGAIKEGVVAPNDTATLQAIVEFVRATISEPRYDGGTVVQGGPPPLQAQGGPMPPPGMPQGMPPMPPGPMPPMPGAM